MTTEQDKPERRPLTKNDMEILPLIGLGLTNAQIGTRLFISEQAVRSRVKLLFARLGVHNRIQAVTIAHERGLLGGEQNKQLRATIAGQRAKINLLEQRLAAKAAVVDRLVVDLAKCRERLEAATGHQPGWPERPAQGRL